MSAEPLPAANCRTNFSCRRLSRSPIKAKQMPFGVLKALNPDLTAPESQPQCKCGS